MTSNVLHISTQAFDRLKNQSVPVLLDFWAPWCGPCRMQAPILDDVSAQLGSRAIVGKVNVDEEPALAQAFGITSIPTLVILKDGQSVARMVGVQSAPTLIQALERAGA